MASVVRALLGASVLGALLGCASCRERAAAPAPEHPAPNLPEDAAAAVDTLLRRSHSRLRNADDMERAMILLARSADDAEPEQVVLGDDDRMHLKRREGHVDLRLPGGAWRVKRGEKPVALDATETARLDRLQGLLRAALLQPLYRAGQIRRQGPSVFQLIRKGGATWRLEVARFDPKGEDPILLPSSLTGAPGAVEWLEYQHGVTHLPRRLRLGEFGEVVFHLRDCGLLIDPEWFQDPFSPAPGKGRRTRTTYEDTPPALRVGEPVLGRTKASRSLVLRDPGDWDKRYELTGIHGPILAEQGQECGDLDFIFEREGVRYFAMPFIMALEDGRPFVAQEGQEVQRLPEQKAVLVRPPKGSLEECERKAREILDRYVAEHRLVAAGPLRIRPLVEMSVRPRKLEELDDIWVQCELPVK